MRAKSLLASRLMVYVVCVSDENSTYSAGAGLALVGSVFSVVNGGIATDMLADSAVTSAKIAPSSVGSLGLVDGAVITAKLADGSVTSSKLAANSVTTSALLNASVTASKVDSTQVQLRMDSCPAGEYITSVNENGTVVCGLPDGASFALRPGMRCRLLRCRR